MKFDNLELIYNKYKEKFDHLGITKETLSKFLYYRTNSLHFQNKHLFGGENDLEFTDSNTDISYVLYEPNENGINTLNLVPVQANSEFVPEVDSSYGFQIGTTRNGVPVEDFIYVEIKNSNLIIEYYNCHTNMINFQLYDKNAFELIIKKIPGISFDNIGEIAALIKRAGFLPDREIAVHQTIKDGPIFADEIVAGEKLSTKMLKSTTNNDANRSFYSIYFEEVYKDAIDDVYNISESVPSK